MVEENFVQAVINLMLIKNVLKYRIQYAKKNAILAIFVRGFRGNLTKDLQ